MKKYKYDYTKAYDELLNCEKRCKGVSLELACKLLDGHNLDKVDRYFDFNTITTLATMREVNGLLKVVGSISVYHDKEHETGNSVSVYLEDMKTLKRLSESKVYCSCCDNKVISLDDKYHCFECNKDLFDFETYILKTIKATNYKLSKHDLGFIKICKGDYDKEKYNNVMSAIKGYIKLICTYSNHQVGDKTVFIFLFELLKKIIELDNKILYAFLYRLNIEINTNESYQVLSYMYKEKVDTEYLPSLNRVLKNTFMELQIYDTIKDKNLYGIKDEDWDYNHWEEKEENKKEVS